MCSGKKSQETQFVWPVKPPAHMQWVTKSSVPVRKQVHSNKSKVMLQDDDRNCQENINRRPMQSQMNDDKKSQADRNCQTSVMQPVKSQQEMQLPKPAVPYEYRRLCKDQTCQSTRCYKKHSDPKKRQKMQYKVKSNWSVSQEDAILDVTSEKLSPRSQKSQVYTKFKNQANMRDIKTQVESLSTVHINYLVYIWIERKLQCIWKTIQMQWHMFKPLADTSTSVHMFMKSK